MAENFFKMLQVIILLGTYHFFQITILSAFYSENAVTVKQLLPGC